MALLAAIGIGSRVLGGIGKRKAAKDQKKAAKQGRNIAYENIETQRKQNAETERRTQRNVAQNEGTAAAASAAGGFALGGQNAQSVLGSLKSENARQMDWLKLANQTKLDTMKKEADYNYRTGKAQAKATQWSAFGDFAGAASATGNAFPDLFKPTTEVLPNPFKLSTPTGGFIKPATNYRGLA